MEQREKKLSVLWNRCAGLSVSWVLLSACSSGARGQEAKSPAETEVPRLIVSPQQVEDLEELLGRAEQALAAEDYKKARELYEKLLDYDEEQRFQLPAWWGLGVAFDQLGEQERAAHFYEQFVNAAPASDKRTQGEVRLVRLLLFLERWEQAAMRARRVPLEGRAPLEEVALLAARAWGGLVAGEESVARAEIAAGRSVLEKWDAEQWGILPLDAAPLFLAEGEWKRRRAEALTFDPIPDDFAAVLEERCQWILDAQAAYSTAMRSQNAHYSAMAGVRVGELYLSLHEDLMKMPPPAAAQTEANKQLVEGALRLRYSILLTKAAKMLEHTRLMVERTGEPTPWRARAEESLAALRLAEQEEERALARLPYTREQLEKALRDLEEKLVDSGGGSGK